MIGENLISKFILSKKNVAIKFENNKTDINSNKKQQNLTSEKNDKN